MNLTRYDFIELVYEYPLYLPLPEKEDYFRLPVVVAKEMNLKTAIFTSRTKLNRQKRETIKGIDVLRFDSIISMLQHLIKSQPILVHGHSFGWLPATFAPVLVRSYVFTPHVYKLEAYSKWKVNLALKFIKNSSAVVALTQFEASQFKSAIAESKINVIPHPIDSDFFSPSRNNEAEKRARNRGLVDKLILCVSNIFPTKNLETLIRGYAIIRKTFQKSRLLIVGAEPKTRLGMLSAAQTNWRYQLELMNLASALGVSKDVVFAGYKRKEELRNYYRMADVFCLPSRKECQSLAAGEAASSGLPLVLSDLEPLREIYQGCALFHESMDYKKLSSNVIEIMENPKLAKTLGSNGRSKVQEYHPTKIKAKLKELYGNTLRQRVHPANN